MKTIDNMLTQFKDFAELQAYAQAQYQTILSLSKKISDLEEKNKQLEGLLADHSQIVKDPEQSSLIITDSDEETICRIELKKLRDRSISGVELTLEETKRVDIYTKLLIALTEKSKDNANAPAAMDDAKLLSLLENINVTDAK